MRKLIYKTLSIFMIMFFIFASATDGTFSLYSTTTRFEGSVSAGGVVKPPVEPPVNPQYDDPYYKVAVGEGNSIERTEDGDFIMKGNADGFIPASAKCDIKEGYTFSVSVTTSEVDDFYGMGFYFYGFANPHNSTVDGLSLQLTTNPLINPEFLFINKSYSSLEEDEDLSDGNDSILFVKEDFWKYDKVINHTTGFGAIQDKLRQDGKYDGKTLDFKIAVKECDNNPDKIRIQATINDFCNGNFTIITDKIDSSDDWSEFSLGVKAFYTEGKTFTFSDIEIGPHEEFEHWKYQADGSW